MARTNRMAIGISWGVLTALTAGDLAGAVDPGLAQSARALLVALAITSAMTTGLREVLAVIERHTRILEQMRAENMEMFTMGRAFEAGAVVPLPRRIIAKPAPGAVMMGATEGSILMFPGGLA